MPRHLPLPTAQPFRDRRQAGGRGGSTPRNPRRHGRALDEQLNTARARPRARSAEGIDPRLVFKIATTARFDDDDWQRRELEFLGESVQGWQYFVITGDADGRTDRLEEQLAAYAGGSDEEGGRAELSSIFGRIERIEPYGPEDRRGPGVPEGGLDEPTVLDVELWPSPDLSTAQERVASVRAALADEASSVQRLDERPRFTVVRARVSPADLPTLLDLPVIEQVRVPPMPYIDPTDWHGASAEDLDWDSGGGTAVGVIDDGVAAAHPLLAELVGAQIEVPSNHDWPPPSNHGTMVAGLAAYGDFEEPLRSHSPLIGRPIHIGRVLEPHPEIPERTQFPGIEHASTDEAIRRLHEEHGVRVFNISITDPAPYSGPRAAMWTETIDSLARELDIVCVVAAGNRPAPRTVQGMLHRRDYPQYCLDEEARLAEPAIAGLAVTVGSIARSAGPATPDGTSRVADRAIAEIDQLSPFSRTGPGVRDKSIKPEVVHYGGNWAVDDAGRLKLNDPGLASVSLNRDHTQQLFAGSAGTSYAAPRVANLAAAIWDAYPQASANLVRALLGVSVRSVSDVQAVNSEDVPRMVGFGHPQQEAAVESGGGRVVMQTTGSVFTDSVVVHPIPIPEPFNRGNLSRRRIRVALAYDPPVRRQRRDYLAGHLTMDLLRDISLHEIEEIYRRQDPKDRRPLINNRRRVKSLQPGPEAVLSNTLQVREWQPKRLKPADGEVYYLVIVHRAAPWAHLLPEPYEQQDYGLCVELCEQDDVDIDVYSLVRQQLEVRHEVEIRV